MSLLTMEYKSEFEYETFFVGCDVIVTGDLEEEHDYGADADGNRGKTIYSIQGGSIQVFDSRKNDITSKLEERAPKEFEKLLNDACAYLLDCHAPSRY